LHINIQRAERQVCPIGVRGRDVVDLVNKIFRIFNGEFMLLTREFGSEF